MSRLTELIDIDGMKIKTAKERPLSNQGLGAILHKLYKLEDLMEQYNINDLAELKIALDIINTSDDEKFIKDSRAYFDKYKINPVSVLQELVDKETPMKVVKETINDSYDNNDRCVSFEWERIKCPKCNEDLVNEYEDRDWDNNDICPFCGQRLDWSDNNED